MTIEEKIYGTMDITSDLEELTALHKELESHPDAGSNADDMKKAKIGLINLKAHLNQVDCEQFATFLRNTFLFKVIRYSSFYIRVNRNIFSQLKFIFMVTTNCFSFLGWLKRRFWTMVRN